MKWYLQLLFCIMWWLLPRKYSVTAWKWESGHGNIVVKTCPNSPGDDPLWKIY